VQQHVPCGRGSDEEVGGFAQGGREGVVAGGGVCRGQCGSERMPGGVGTIVTVLCPTENVWKNTTGRWEIVTRQAGRLNV